jgi:putative endonuclease
MTTRQEARGFGQQSEALAERHLLRKGYRLVGRNVRLPQGEVDLIVRQGAVLVFVEVKARRSAAMGGAAFAVTPAKQRRLVQLAAQYLSSHQLRDQICRFDVVLIEQQRDAPATVTHIENAFEVSAHHLRC